MSGICPCTFINSASNALLHLKNAKKLNCDIPEETASATAIFRRVQRTSDATLYQESPWLYLVTFRLEDGRELELKTQEQTYALLKEDSSWTITWQEDRLRAFEKKEE